MNEIMVTTRTGIECKLFKTHKLDILFLIWAFSFLLSQCDTESDQDDKVRLFTLGWMCLDPFERLLSVF